MSAQIIPLRPDTYLPLRFETPPVEALEIHADHELATLVMQFAQAMRCEIQQRGEPLTPRARGVLEEMKDMIMDHLHL